MSKFIICLLIPLSLNSFFINAEEPYYGFYPSEKGLLYKLFRHNLYNFEIQLPKNWIFGVAGKVPNQVIIMYPQELNVSQFSSIYETITVGIIPISNITLDKSYEYTMLGMESSHNKLVIIKAKNIVTVNGNPAINVVYQWPSKTGNIINESVYLIKYGNKIYSLTTRTTTSGKKLNIHQSIINTFNPIKNRLGEK